MYFCLEGPDVSKFERAVIRRNDSIAFDEDVGGDGKNVCHGDEDGGEGGEKHHIGSEAA